MKSTISTLLLSIGILAMLITIGCSSNTSDPLTPLTENPALASATAETGAHGVLGTYELVFDEENTDLAAIEARGADTHYNITPYIAPHVSASLISWDPITRILEFKLEITNPSALDVFDVRTLFLTDAASGYELLNPDDYTKLFNPFGPDDVNPFRAYAKSTPSRVFAGGATHGETFEVLIPPPPGGSARLLVECSWPGNCEEAYEISNQAVSNPITTTVSATISLDAYDHQNNISAISIDTTPITGGLTWLTNTGGTLWEGTIINSVGAPAGDYVCRIAAQDTTDPWELYDFLMFEIDIPASTPDWTSADYPIPAASCSYDLGVIADPGGPRDSEILMVDPNSDNCSKIIKYDPYYAATSGYVDLQDYDAANTFYQPYPVLRLDAADDGAFSFTNDNYTLPYPGLGSDIYNDQVWSVFDNFPKLHLGPSPDEGRYYFDMADSDVWTRPIDVCDDFTLGQYAIFSTGETWSPRDLLVIGTMPNSYTHDMVRYVGNLDAWVGCGEGVVDPDHILGIDVVEYLDTSGDDEMYCTVYILEKSASHYEVEVFNIYNSAPMWIDDFVTHVMTFSVHIPGSMGFEITAHDIELLPINNEYELNPSHPTACILISYVVGGVTHGEVLLYDAVTGAIIESIGEFGEPAMPQSMVMFLDTDDDDWEIHVTREDSGGNTVATVFSYSP